jgi:small subunit ribosomal protein S4
MRLDSIIFQLGMAPTVSAARQIVNHGHILVNNQSVDIPSYQCKPQDLITVQNRKGSRKLIENNLETNGVNELPNHLTFNASSLLGEVKSLVQRDFISLKINELLVVEYYSRKV